ncbi:class I SAM-dependent methyltransferase [Salinimicrobium flavum]|uniref:Class I SAM-dependent methyltransferase n=1 Tax=Salinimicrobium flavum TaxID=1737065 RepID=A0ABW5IXM4_9FLAO
MFRELENVVLNSPNRFELWEKFIVKFEIKYFAEIGVYRGEFAEAMLRNCQSLEKYFMIDPWRYISDWNKPANTSNREFEKYYNETLSRTDFARNKRLILRGRTKEIAGDIADNSLDLVYIDGDHTLKGISIDLLTYWNKIKNNGFIAGDDFCPNIWQHKEKYEPTLVFPYAVYFAEAVDFKIFALPFNQFIISKNHKGFEFVNLSGDNYSKDNLLNQMEYLERTRKYTWIDKIFKRL